MNETILISAIVVYGLFIIFGTKWVFELMMARNMKENVAIYYNRKILHMFCGGLIGMMAPSILSEPIYALYIGILFTIITYIPYYTGHLLYWVQTKDNKNDVNFCFMGWSFCLYTLGITWRSVSSNYSTTLHGIWRWCYWNCS